MLGEGEETQWSLLLYSLMIIVREGLEALLIVAAIVAYMVKNNHQDKLPLIRQSVIVALIASVITAAIFQMLFTNSGASRELLEGITMLIAVVMLFFMSYWLLSKVEARHWKAWLEGKLSHSLSRGSLVGLWLTSFLAVYREGAETVLFYYALIGDANTVSGHMAIGAVCDWLRGAAARLAGDALLSGAPAAETLLYVYRQFHVSDGLRLCGQRRSGTGGRQTVPAYVD